MEISERMRINNPMKRKEIRDKVSMTHKILGTKPPNQKGFKHNNDTKRKISIAHLGKIISLETRRKLSIVNSGKNNHRWRGGITPLRHRIYTSFKTRQWRSDIFTRDNFTCQECGINNIKLEAHHIKPFYKILEENNINTLEEALNCEELWNINNGITLCYKCHNNTKKGRTKKQNERERDTDNNRTLS